MLRPRTRAFHSRLSTCHTAKAPVTRVRDLLSMFQPVCLANIKTVRECMKVFVSNQNVFITGRTQSSGWPYLSSKVGPQNSLDGRLLIVELEILAICQNKFVCASVSMSGDVTRHACAERWHRVNGTAYNDTLVAQRLTEIWTPPCDHKYWYLMPITHKNVWDAGFVLWNNEWNKAIPLLIIKN